MKKQVIAIGLAANLNFTAAPADALNHSVINFEERFIAPITQEHENPLIEKMKMYPHKSYRTLQLEEEFEKLRLEKEEQERLEKEDRLLTEQKEQERIDNVQFNSYDIRIVSGITHSEMATILAGTGLEEISDAFVDAEREYGVNAIALAAIPALESGWNNSHRAKNGSNNLIGMDVQEDSDKGTYYLSKYECIMDLARQLKTFYLTPGAMYYNGPSTSGVNVKYCASPNWYKKIDTIGDELMAKYREYYQQKNKYIE